MLNISEERCPQDHRCPLMRLCPVDAISQEGFGLPVIDQEKCINCGICARTCPLRAVVEMKEPVPV